jgi:hypothetical protein
MMAGRFSIVPGRNRGQHQPAQQPQQRRPSSPSRSRSRSPEPHMPPPSQVSRQLSQDEKQREKDRIRAQRGRERDEGPMPPLPPFGLPQRPGGFYPPGAPEREEFPPRGFYPPGPPLGERDEFLPPPGRGFYPEREESGPPFPPRGGFYPPGPPLGDRDEPPPPFGPRGFYPPPPLPPAQQSGGAPPPPPGSGPMRMMEPPRGGGWMGADRERERERDRGGRGARGSDFESASPVKREPREGGPPHPFPPRQPEFSGAPSQLTSPGMRGRFPPGGGLPPPPPPQGPAAAGRGFYPPVPLHEDDRSRRDSVDSSSHHGGGPSMRGGLPRPPPPPHHGMMSQGESLSRSRSEIEIGDSSSQPGGGGGERPSPFLGGMMSSPYSSSMKFEPQSSELSSPALESRASASGRRGVGFGMSLSRLERMRTGPEQGPENTNELTTTTTTTTVQMTTTQTHGVAGGISAGLMSPIRLEAYQPRDSGYGPSPLGVDALGQSPFRGAGAGPFDPHQSHHRQMLPHPRRVQSEEGSYGYGAAAASPEINVNKKLLFQPSPRASPATESPADAAGSGSGSGFYPTRRLFTDGYPLGSPEHPGREREFTPFAPVTPLDSRSRKEADEDAEMQPAPGDEKAAAAAAAAASSASEDEKEEEKEELPNIPAHMLEMNRAAIVVQMAKIEDSWAAAQQKRDKLLKQLEDARALAARQAKLKADLAERAAKLQAEKEAAQKAAAEEAERKRKEQAEKEGKELEEIKLEEPVAAAASPSDAELTLASPPAVELQLPTKLDPIRSETKKRLALWYRSPRISNQLASILPYRVYKENQNRAAQAHAYVSPLYTSELHAKFKEEIRVEQEKMASRHRMHLLPSVQAAEKHRRGQEKTHQWRFLTATCQITEPLIYVRVEADQFGGALLQLNPVVLPIPKPAAPPKSYSPEQDAEMKDTLASSDVAAPATTGEAAMSDEDEPPAAPPLPAWLDPALAHDHRSAHHHHHHHAASSSRSRRLSVAAADGGGHSRSKSKSLPSTAELNKKRILSAMHSKIQEIQAALKKAGKAGTQTGQQVDQLSVELLRLTQPNAEGQFNSLPDMASAFDLFGQLEEQQRPLNFPAEPVEGAPTASVDDDETLQPLYTEPRESLLYQENLRRFAAQRTRISAALIARKRNQHKYFVSLAHTYKTFQQDWLRWQHDTLQKQLEKQITGMSIKQYQQEMEGRRATLRSRQTSEGASVTSSISESLHASISYYTSITSGSPAATVSSLSAALPPELASLVPVPASTIPPTEAQKRLRYLRCTAALPQLLVDPHERAARAYDNRNGLVLDPLQEEKDYQNKNPWTEYEKKIFEKKFLKNPKQFRKIASFLPNKNVNECVAYYYHSKLRVDYKKLLRAQSRKNKKAGGAAYLAASGGADGEVGAEGDDHDHAAGWGAGGPNSPGYGAAAQLAHHAANPYHHLTLTKPAARGGLALMAGPIPGAEDSAAAGTSGVGGEDMAARREKAAAKKAAFPRELFQLYEFNTIGASPAASPVVVQTPGVKSRAGVAAAVEGVKTPAVSGPSGSPVSPQVGSKAWEETPAVTMQPSPSTSAPVPQGQQPWRTKDSKKERERKEKLAAAAAAAAASTGVQPASTAVPPSPVFPSRQTSEASRAEQKDSGSGIVPPSPLKERQVSASTAAAGPTPAAAGKKEEPSPAPSSKPKRDREKERERARERKLGRAHERERAAAAAAAGSSESESEGEDASSVASATSEDSETPRRKKAKKDRSETAGTSSTPAVAQQKQGKKRDRSELSDVSEEEESEATEKKAAKPPATPVAAAKDKDVVMKDREKAEKDKEKEQPPAKKPKLAQSSSTTSLAKEKEKEKPKSAAVTTPVITKKEKEKEKSKKRAASPSSSSSSSSSASSDVSDSSSSESESESSSSSSSEAESSDEEMTEVTESDASSKKKSKPKKVSEKKDSSSAGAKRKSVAGGEKERAASVVWQPNERELFLAALEQYGKNWSELSKAVGTKTEAKCKNYYNNHRARLKLDEKVQAFEERKRKAAAEGKVPTPAKTPSAGTSAAAAPPATPKLTPAPSDTTKAASVAAPPSSSPQKPKASPESKPESKGAVPAPVKEKSVEKPEPPPAAKEKEKDREKPEKPKDTEKAAKQPVEKEKEKPAAAEKEKEKEKEKGTATAAAAAAAAPEKEKEKKEPAPAGAAGTNEKPSSKDPGVAAKEREKSKEETKKTEESSETTKTTVAAAPSVAATPASEAAATAAPAASSPPAPAGTPGVDMNDPTLWSGPEKQKLIQAISIYGKQWERVAAFMGSRSQSQVEGFYKKYKNKLNLVALVEQAEESRRASMKGSPLKKKK